MTEDQVNKYEKVNKNYHCVNVQKVLISLE